jgi:hypothetical protein
VAVIVRHFRCLQGKEARQTAQKAVQKGRRKKREGVGSPKMRLVALCAGVSGLLRQYVKAWFTRRVLNNGIIFTE